MSERNRVARARGDEDRQQRLGQAIDPRDHLQILLAPAMPPGIALVWNPTGTGRLRRVRFVHGPSHPSMRTGGLDLYDQWISLDDVALMQWRYATCPTCEQLVRAAIRRPEEIRRVTSVVRALTCESLGGDPARSVPALAWLFALLPAGLYAVTLDSYVPTTGDDTPTWGAYANLEVCPALRQIYRYARPRYLLPTQQRQCVSIRCLETRPGAFPNPPGDCTLSCGCRISPPRRAPPRACRCRTPSGVSLPYRDARTRRSRSARPGSVVCHHLRAYR